MTPRLIGVKGTFLVKEDRIIFEVDPQSRLPSVLESLTEEFLIKKEGKIFEPFKEATLKNMRIAAEYGLISEIKWMIDQKVVPDTKILRLAVEHGQLETVKFLLDRNILVNKWLITYATKEGHIEIVRLLLDRKVPISENVIAYAAKNGHIEIIKFLIDHKAPVDV